MHRLIAPSFGPAPSLSDVRKKQRRRPKPDLVNAITVSVDDACSITGLSRSFIYELMVKNVLDARKAGSRRLILVESLRRYIDSLPTA